MKRALRRSSFTAVLGFAVLACGSSDGEPLVLDLGYAGAQESFVWFGYYRFRPRLSFPSVPQVRCRAYEEIGNCWVPRPCPSPEPPDESPQDREPTRSLDPGTITVAGVPLAFDEFGQMLSASFNPTLPLGEPIPYTVSGSKDVPAHEGDFVLPAPVAVVEPNVSAPVVVDRTRALIVRWTSTDGVVGAGIRDDLDADVYVSCSAPGAYGELEIPVDVLARLPDSADLAVRPLSFAVWRPDEQKTFEVGSWTIRLTIVGRSLDATAVVN